MSFEEAEAAGIGRAVVGPSGTIKWICGIQPAGSTCSRKILVRSEYNQDSGYLVPEPDSVDDVALREFKLA